MIIDAIVAALMPAVVPAAADVLAEGSLIPNLLTGGGFVFLAAVMGGLFLMNKNAADGAKSIAEGAREYVDGAREDLKASRAELADARTALRDCNHELELARREATEARRDMHSAHTSLEDAQVAIRAGQNERARLRRWINELCEANLKHTVWEDELRAKLAEKDIDIGPAPALTTTPPSPGE